jgi:hypothetical protein
MLQAILGCKASVIFLAGAIHRLKEKALEIEIRVSCGIDANLWKNQLQFIARGQHQ